MIVFPVGVSPTSPITPVNERETVPVSASATLTRRSSGHHAATHAPSAPNEGASDAPFPDTVASSVPPVSHTRTYPSSPVVANREPSGDEAIAVMSPSCA